MSKDFEQRLAKHEPGTSRLFGNSLGEDFPSRVSSYNSEGGMSRASSDWEGPPGRLVSSGSRISMDSGPSYGMLDREGPPMRVDSNASQGMGLPRAYSDSSTDQFFPSQSSMSFLRHNSLSSDSYPGRRDLSALSSQGEAAGQYQLLDREADVAKTLTNISSAERGQRNSDYGVLPGKKRLSSHLNDSFELQGGNSQTARSGSYSHPHYAGSNYRSEWYMGGSLRQDTGVHVAAQRNGNTKERKIAGRGSVHHQQQHTYYPRTEVIESNLQAGIPRSESTHGTVIDPNHDFPETLYREYITVHHSLASDPIEIRLNLSDVSFEKLVQADKPMQELIKVSLKKHGAGCSEDPEYMDDQGNNKIARPFVKECSLNKGDQQLIVKVQRKGPVGDTEKWLPLTKCHGNFRFDFVFEILPSGERVRSRPVEIRSKQTLKKR